MKLMFYNTNFNSSNCLLATIIFNFFNSDLINS